METSTLEQLLSVQWRAAVSECRNSLEREDLRQVLDHNSWDELQQQLASGRAGASPNTDFAMLTPALLKLRIFVNVWVSRCGPNIETSAFWGLTRLVIKLVQEKNATLRVPRMLRDVCNKVGILNTYFEGNTFDPASEESCMECALVILSFFSYIVEFLRKNTGFYGSGHLEDEKWRPLEDECSSNLRKIDELISRIERLAKFAERSRRTETASGLQRQTTQSVSISSRPMSSYDDPAQLPCVVLPPTGMSRFFDRDDILKVMDAHFNEDSSKPSFRSLAIHGLGGVGKSTVAMRYALAKRDRDELDALFWVHSEKLLSLRQSFTNIALRLKLPDARPGNDEENYVLVLNWLQHTQCRWLIVFDNAEIPDLIRAHWPLARRGQAVITTRNPSIAFELVDRGLEIPTWDNETGLRFLLYLLSVDIGTELIEEEAKSAQELSEKLRGHALAISTMAGLIHRRHLSIAEFTKFYDQHPDELHGISGNRSINALWEISFKTLDSHSQAILGVMSFLEPDSISQALFEPRSSTDLSEDMKFCIDPFRFSEAIETLLESALLKRDKVSRTLSLHRLVQTSFKHFMTSEQRQQAFNNATILVAKAYPRKDAGGAQLYFLWQQCAQYTQHVISLKDCFREELKSNPDFRTLQAYCELSNACQRYLLEIGSYDELLDLIEVNTIAFDTLPKEEQLNGIAGSLTSHRGQLLCRLGRAPEGVEWLRKSFDLDATDDPVNDSWVAWAAENGANGIATMNNFPEAIEWYERARDYWLKGGGDVCHEVILNNWGKTLFWAGNPAKARELMTQALSQIEKKEPFNWANAAYTHFGLGTVDRHDRRYDAAEAHFMESQNLWIKGEQMRSDPHNAACLYRLGCTALDRGAQEAAVNYLRDAVAFTELRKHNMLAEYTRCLFKLSEALEQEPRNADEAGKMREEAERLLRILSPGTELNPGLEATYDSFVNILWR